jgi:hypothetical protein
VVVPVPVVVVPVLVPVVFVSPLRGLVQVIGTWDRDGGGVEPVVVPVVDVFVPVVLVFVFGGPVTVVVVAPVTVPVTPVIVSALAAATAAFARARARAGGIALPPAAWHVTGPADQFPGGRQPGAAAKLIVLTAATFSLPAFRKAASSSTRPAGILAASIRASATAGIATCFAIHVLLARPIRCFAWMSAACAVGDEQSADTTAARTGIPN